MFARCILISASILISVIWRVIRYDLRTEYMTVNIWPEVIMRGVQACLDRCIMERSYLEVKVIFFTQMSDVEDKEAA